MPDVSIIVPIYNSECYLAECLDSILAQSYSDFELILVDDGSTDGSTEICDEYIKKDSRIKCYRVENGGVSYARNIGLDKSQGKYVTFVDSDDFVSPDFLLVGVNQMNADEGLDFIQFSIDRFDDGGVYFVEESSDTRQPLIEYVKNSGFLGSACASLMKNNIIKSQKIRFNTSLVLGEDQAFVYEYMSFCRQCAKRSEIKYHYRSNQQSATHSPSPESLMKSIKFFKTFKYREMFSKRVDSLLLSLSIQLASIKHVPMKDIYLLCKDIDFRNVDKGTRKLEDVFLKIFPYSKHLAIFIIRVLNAKN